MDDPWRRFQIELEFVQCLGNPNYLNCTILSQQGCFDKSEFINYLAYLQYWKEPAYSKYLLYVYCGAIGELLYLYIFNIARAPSARFIDDQVLLHWQSYLRKRSELISKHIEKLGASTNMA
ncbi:unnamed protein product [Dibothriocephalus latus]|uniref:Mediator of RNA polymerase II transcription subunit 31 n=1 Tax=Dibothriocephalus latus TaxID=60516 RepID=A0A3P7L8L1_DIBLA|nr:unnamed protein product [Dibothriocephalus latus]